MSLADQRRRRSPTEHRDGKSCASRLPPWNAVRTFSDPPDLPSSLAQTVRTLGQRAHSVKALTCGNIKRLLVGAGECGVGGLARDLDGPEILTLGIEHLNACDRGDKDAVVTIDRDAVCATFRARGNV